MRRRPTAEGCGTWTKWWYNVDLAGESTEVQTEALNNAYRFGVMKHSILVIWMRRKRRHAARQPSTLGHAWKSTRACGH